MFEVISFLCVALAISVVVFLVRVSPQPMKSAFVVLVVALAVVAVVAGKIYVARNNTDTYRVLLMPVAVAGHSLAWAASSSVLWLVTRSLVALSRRMRK